MHTYYTFNKNFLHPAAYAFTKNAFYNNDQIHLTLRLKVYKKFKEKNFITYFNF